LGGHGWRCVSLLIWGQGKNPGGGAGTETSLEKRIERILRVRGHKKVCQKRPWQSVDESQNDNDKYTIVDEGSKPEKSHRGKSSGAEKNPGGRKK